MHSLRPLGALLVAATLLAGCANLEDEWRRDRNRRQNPSCGVDVRYWENRADQFKSKRFKNPDNFKAAKTDLVRDMKAVDTSGCGKRVRRNMEQLINEVLVVQM